jgi:hypothetical protein
MKNVLRTVSALGILAIASAANAQVTNGGFETGDFTGWTLTGTSYTSVTTGAAHSGTFFCYTGPISPATIGQNLTGVNAGDQVEVHFWLGLDNGGPNSFSATLDGQALMIPLVNSGGFDYTEYVATVTVANANPALVFTVYDSPAYWYLDDVSAAVVPAPGAAAALGLGGLAAFRRRRA